jgi:hypothetical protein
LYAASAQNFGICVALAGCSFPVGAELVADLPVREVGLEGAGVVTVRKLELVLDSWRPTRDRTIDEE